MRVGLEFYAPRPARVVFDLLRSWALILAAVTACALWRDPLVWVLGVVVIGCQQYALQILHHDGMHRTLFRSRRLNDLVTRFLLSLPLFAPLGPFRHKHLEHHKWLGQPADPDRYYHTTAGKHTRARLLLFLLGLQAALAGVLGALRGPARAHEEVKARRPVPGAGLDWLFMLLTQVGLGVSLTVAAGPLGYPVLWVLPFGVFVFQAQTMRSFAEHASPEPDEPADARGRLVTYRSWWLERVFFAPNNMNHHAEHHLHPQVPYYHLPALRAHLRASPDWSAIEERGSYLGFLWRYLRSLPILPAGQAPLPSADPMQEVKTTS